jgi:hypothetical protein
MKDLAWPMYWLAYELDARKKSVSFPGSSERISSSRVVQTVSGRHAASLLTSYPNLSFFIHFHSYANYRYKYLSMWKSASAKGSSQMTHGRFTSGPRYRTELCLVQYIWVMSSPAYMTDLYPVQHIGQSYVRSSIYDRFVSGPAYRTELLLVHYIWHICVRSSIHERVMSGPVYMTDLYPVQHIGQSYVWSSTYDIFVSGPAYMKELCPVQYIWQICIRSSINDRFIVPSSIYI